MAEDNGNNGADGGTGDGNNPPATLLDGKDTQPGAGGEDTLAGGSGNDTIDGAGGSDDGNKPYWPDDWRNNLAGGDEKLLKRLERMGGPKDLLNSWRAMEQKMSSGEMATKLSDDPSDEEIAAYRKENGIPDTAEGYLDKLPDGLVIGEDDKELAGSFLETAHASHMPPEFVGQALNWYNTMQEEQAAEIAADDKQYEQKSEDALRSEWGSDYRLNINTIKSFLDSAPETENGEKLGELLMGARLANGTPLGVNPTAMSWLLDAAKAANPTGFIAPGDSLGQIDSVETEIAEIEKLMRTDRPAYNKDEKKQARYRQLLEAREKLSAA